MVARFDVEYNLSPTPTPLSKARHRILEHIAAQSIMGHPQKSHASTASKLRDAWNDVS